MTHPLLLTVTISTIDAVIREMTASNAIKLLCSLSLHQKLFLFALTIHFKQSGISEGDFGNVRGCA